MDVPTISCGSYVAQEALSVTVTAGPNTGAPAGFSLQWMTEAEYIANGNQWYTSDVVCKASFSGNANGYNYALAKNQTITVRLGDSSEDFSGASTSCSADFICGTTYIIRAFAHATSTINNKNLNLNKFKTR